jgi:hypothetical protein
LLNTFACEIGNKGGCQVGKLVVYFYGALQPVLRLAMVKGVIHEKFSPDAAGNVACEFCWLLVGDDQLR